jgi:hypothetical protein
MDALAVDDEVEVAAADAPSIARPRRHRPHPWIRRVLNSGAYRLLGPKLANEGFRSLRRSRSRSKRQKP